MQKEIGSKSDSKQVCSKHLASFTEDRSPKPGLLGCILNLRMGDDSRIKLFAVSREFLLQAKMSCKFHDSPSKESPGVARVVLVGEYPEVHSQTGTAAGRVGC